MNERRSDPEDGAASRPCWASPSSPASAGDRGASAPHPRAPGSGPRGRSRLCRSALTRPRLPGPSVRASAVLRASVRPFAAVWPAPAFGGWALGRSGFACRFAAPLASSLARWLGLPARGPAPRSGGRSPRGSPPAGGSSARLRPLSAGSARASLRGPPSRGLRLALRGSAGSLGGRPWPVSGLGFGPSRGPSRRPGSPFARPPPAGGGSSPCGARPGLVAPGGRRGPAGRFWRLCRPPGLGSRGVGLPPSGGNLLWNDGRLRGPAVMISAR